MFKATIIFVCAVLAVVMAAPNPDAKADPKPKPGGLYHSAYVAPVHYNTPLVYSAPITYSAPIHYEAPLTYDHVPLTYSSYPSYSVVAAPYVSTW